MCGEKNYISYTRLQDHLRVQVFLGIEQDPYEEWLKEETARRELQVLESMNLKDMHLQFSNGGNLSRRRFAHEKSSGSCSKA